MKIRNLKNYGIPSYVLDIWKENYSTCLLPLQEEAVRDYGWGAKTDAIYTRMIQHIYKFKKIF
jgi:CRISPR/Cas system CMR subunit Cmr6 (Cas7 group RAMP superfamily)